MGSTNTSISISSPKTCSNSDNNNLQFSPITPDHQITHPIPPSRAQPHRLLTMSCLDSHPRLLSLHHAPSDSIPSPASNSSIVSTPIVQSTRTSQDSAHAAHHFVSLGTPAGNDSSLRKLWIQIKQAARDHHRSVNAAYEATHGAGRVGAAPIGGVRV